MPAKEKIEIGYIIGDFTIIKDLGNVNGRHRKILVECNKCHRKREVFVQNFIKKRQGITHKSCGYELSKNDKRFYSIWKGMRQRTNNINHSAYKYYGECGINSNVWEYFIDFYDDMYESYAEHVNEFGEEDTTLDRIDTNNNYYKENCRWATRSEQMRNTKRNKMFKAVSPKGEVFYSNCQIDFSKEHKLSVKSIRRCLNDKKSSNYYKGWYFEYV